MLLPVRGRAARTETIDPDTAEQILDYLETFGYATYQLVSIALMWDCDFRIGAVRTLNLQDYHSEGAYVELHHRLGDDDRGTPIEER